MKSRQKNINSYWSYLLIEEIVRNDITQFYISPGSRSTPLTIAAAENDNARKTICYDERSAAFQAIGYARSAEKPAVMICTSGTAAANYFPAVIEAKNSHLPLLLLTADRPPELKQCSANQTIDQVKLYGDYVKWYFEFPCPDDTIPPKMVLSTIDHAISRMRTQPAGPVHLNCMFREPLEPSKIPFNELQSEGIGTWEKSGSPYTTYNKARIVTAGYEVTHLTKRIKSNKKGILVVGQLNTAREKLAVKNLATKLRWPVFADFLSGIRQKNKSLKPITYFDQLLLSDKIKRQIQPDIILHIGRPLTSKRYLQFCLKKPRIEYIQISGSDQRSDPGHIVSQHLNVDIASLCDELAKNLRPGSQGNWDDSIDRLNTKVQKVIDISIRNEDQISEISVARQISGMIPTEHGLFIGNSMPVRDFDMYAGADCSTSHISSNRGASGIDGTLSSAIGFAQGLGRPVTVVLGDLAMIHDLNAFSQLNNSEQPITLVIVNNEGGGIFSFLPVAKFKSVFEKYFATGHHIRFKYLADMFDIAFANPLTNQEFKEVYQKSIAAKKTSVIEISTDRKENHSLHLQLQQKIISALEK